MSHEKLRPEFTFDEEKIKLLKQIAPECFEDGKINFETLKQNLGNWAQDEDGDLEHFGLFWPGKKDARRIAAIPPEGTLVPVYGEGLKTDGTPDTDGVNDSKNIFIEGENLEVLKILQKSYAGKIKMIYIDPPYNTGNDFVYDDDFTEPLQEYLRRTGQVDEEGKALTTNKRSDGRFHSKWLSMMYPRLRLARNLLQDDGVIFVSIDDNEIHNLKCLLNEIFGEENYFGTIVWKKKTNGNNVGNIPPVHDFILCYGNISNENSLLGFPLSQEYIEKNYSNPDNDSRGDWTTSDLSANHEGPYFEIINPNTGKGYLPPEGRYWVFNQKEVEKRILDGRIIFGKTGKAGPIQKKFLGEKDSLRVKPESWWDNHGMNSDGTKEIADLVGPKFFSHPKPSVLIKHLINISTKESDIVLDFFAGSGTTGHALASLNKEDKGNRRFILVQYPEEIEEKEPAYKKGFRIITELTFHRLKSAFEQLGNDIGFKKQVLKSSNYKSWINYSGTSVSELEENLDLFNQEPLREGWTKEGLLSEIILMEGFVLSSAIEMQEQYTKNEVKKVSDEYCEHSLLVCLDDKIVPETIASLELSGSDIFICLDSAISNVDKLRLSDKGLIKTI